MVRLYSVDNNCRLLVLSTKICTQLYMSTFHIVVNRFTNIMK